MSKKRQPKITVEDFDAWRHNPITEAVFRHLMSMTEKAGQAWLSALDAETPIDPRALQLLQAELKAKREFAHDMISLELRDIQEEDDEREREQRVN